MIRRAKAALWLICHYRSHFLCMQKIFIHWKYLKLRQISNNNYIHPNVNSKYKLMVSKVFPNVKSIYFEYFVTYVCQWLYCLNRTQKDLLSKELR